ncbi:DUF1365 domain-containing protein [Terricaulis sp.]|uniref:DUF1365 domain-containing protein n=1 Tax=Terricaulis sp. TaxID=2768686 RepID=UPI003784A2C2
MNSALFTGHVAHARPGKHKLRYRVFMFAIDLEELDALDQRLRLFSHNRLNLFALHDRDHAERLNAPIRPQIEAKLAAAGLPTGGKITLLALPRILNYVFNPISVYFCFDRAGGLAAIVHQVNNTFGERHFYVLPAHADNDGVVRQECAKDFFVSPFLEMDLRYRFAIRPPGEAVSIAMVVTRGRDVALAASFAGEWREFTDANLLRAWLGNPLLTFGVIAGIHWEALKMLARGVRYLGRGKKYGAPAPAGETPALHSKADTKTAA